MGKNFLLNGNICGDRVRIGRALHKPPLTQSDLARKLNLMGMEMTTLIVSRIEKKAKARMRWRTARFSQGAGSHNGLAL